ncbi:ATP-binding cassette sub-family A member 3 [Nymphon striatum]|nr:ATP-binding cassette sub-family A member 3 [Nymphon striatum]
MEVYLSYELAPQPPSLFLDGLMRKSPKNTLGQLFRPKAPLESCFPDDVMYIVDGGYLLRVVIWPANPTYSQVCDSYVSYTERLYGNEAIVVFGGYKCTTSTKSAEQKRRATKSSSRDIMFDESMQTVTTQSAFLSNDRNKTRLISMLVQKFKDKFIKTRQATADADRLIVETALSELSTTSVTAVSGLLFLIAYIPYICVQSRYSTLTLPEKLLLSLFGNTAMSFGGQLIVMWEGSGSGIQLHNLSMPVSPDDTLTLSHILLMLLLDSILYFLITWYVEAVYPGEYGLSQPLYFPFMPSYWCGTSPKCVTDTEYVDGTTQNNQNIEANPVGLKTGISIQSLTKVYPPNNIAVKDLSLQMYKDQITVLLGHNGAGKTTVMALLTGSHPPTRGTALLNNFDIRTNISNIRKSLGFCPQHDILFDDLTVEEHFYFFCVLKGYNGRAITIETNYMLRMLNLEYKRKALSKTLSGGMKRKLSVGIALCAESEIVMLDEPTSGMDPAARRSTWDLLNQMKKNRTILLTTHYMEEADVLGDRIAILSRGILQCCGSSMFLKKKYGAGYHMVLVKDSTCKVETIADLVTEFVPKSEMESNMGAELSFILPHESSPNFQALFQNIEDNKVALGISSYGASITTMEEVFIKVGERIEFGESAATQLISNENYSPLNSMLQNIDTESSNNSRMTDDCRTHNKGMKLFLQQVHALLVKRILFTWRNKYLTFSQLAIPVILMTFALLIIQTIPKLDDSSSLVLDLKVFHTTKVPATKFDSNYKNIDQLFSIYRNQFVKSFDQFVKVKVDTDASFIKYLSNVGEKDISKFSLHWIIGATFKQGKRDQMEISAFFNNQPYHAAPISLSMAQSALLRYYTGSNYSFTVVNHPLPRTADIKEVSGGENNYQVAQNLMFGFAFLSASFIVFLVKERAVGAKHLQVVSGVNLATFWITTFLWDLINYLIPCVAVLILFYIFNNEDYTDAAVQGSTFVLLFMHGIAILPLIYCLSFLFTVSATAYTRTCFMTVIPSFVALISVTMMEMPQMSRIDLSKTLDWIFSILPMFCLGRGNYEIYQNHGYIKLCNQFFNSATIYFNVSDREKLCEDAAKLNNEIPCCPQTCNGPNSFCLKYSENYFAWEAPGIGKYLVFLSSEFFFFVLILVGIEKNLFQRMKCLFSFKNNLKNPTSEQIVIPSDDDVEREKERILKTPLSRLSESDALIFRGLTKNYGDCVAVDHLSLGIKRGECFGLLGMNGAGKTSTFKMITGDEDVSEGNAYLEGFSILDNISEAQKRLGYCPQFDALIDEFTGSESLRLFARLRGIPESRIDHIIKKLSEDLIGGNKRKLSTAIALIGNSPVIFLDEPTSGVDPVARRLMWKSFTDVKNNGRSVLLSSHSMEECEALCGQLVIMVNGECCCLGSPQHLKNKFSKGYTVLVKIKADDESCNTLHSSIHSVSFPFTYTKLKGLHYLFIHYHIPTGPDVGWANIFGVMESAKEKYHIEDYTVSQTSLEQVFLQFAALQRAGSC